MTSVLADIRPDSFNFPLFLHVFGAMILFGAVVAAVVTLLTPGGGDPAGLRRFAFRMLLFVGLPAYIVMRIGAQWLYSKGYDDLPEDTTWLEIGFIVADIGLLLFVVALLCAGIASRKSSAGLARAAAIIGALVLVGMIVAVWAMGAKPD